MNEIEKLESIIRELKDNAESLNIYYACDEFFFESSGGSIKSQDDGFYGLGNLIGHIYDKFVIGQWSINYLCQDYSYTALVHAKTFEDAMEAFRKDREDEDISIISVRRI